MTIRDISELLIPESGPSPQDDDHLALIDTWVIGAVSDIVNEWDWDCLRTRENIPSVATQAEYSLATTAASVLSVRIPVNDRYIECVTEETLKEFGCNMEQTSDVTLAWYPSGYDESTGRNKIKFWPIPTTATVVWEVTEKKRIDALLSTSNLPLPAEFNELIKSGARIRIFQHNLQFQAMSYWAQRFELLMQKLKSAQSHQLAQRFGRGATDVRQRSTPFGPRLDPAHYRNRY